MKIRSSRISASIARAICEDDESDEAASPGLAARFAAFFSFFRLPLKQYRPSDFYELRRNIWQLDEAEYYQSFEESARASSRKPKDREDESELVPVGDLGYSGSTFFTTANSKYLIKSLPRRFEHEFFTHDLFDAYVAHVSNNPASLLVRITDMPYTRLATLGGIVGTAPTHHIVMENLMYGKELETDEDMRKSWETYDLKPRDYFFPERDIADGMLAPASIKDKLVDEFPDTVKVPAAVKKELVDILNADTRLLADHLAVDYSLFLVRYPGPRSVVARSEVPFIRSNTSEWRTGVDDAEGKWTYRAVVLDFFWAKHKFQAMAMTGLVGMFNLVAKKGPMSITADPTEYRQRFMKMVNALVVEQEE